MGEQTAISWTDSTVNFWSGCTKVSPGCSRCYAKALSNRGLTSGKGGSPTIGKWGKGAPRRLHESAFSLAVKLNKKPFVCDTCGSAQADAGYPPGCPQCGNSPFHRRRIFSLSLGDWLDPEVPVAWLARMLETVFRCQDMDWQLLTKRLENCLEHIAKALNYACFHASQFMAKPGFMDWLDAWREGKPPGNVWLGTSVEDQKRADERIPALLKIPAAVRFLSVEPLLSPVDLLAGINFMIIGGESGPRARPCHVDWIKSILTQCQNAGLPCFIKQLGAFAITDEASPDGWPPGTEIESTCEGYRVKLKHPKGGDPAEWPADLRVRQFPLAPRA